ncbi:acetate--CoA ligase family protein [Roseibium sp. RKSG952]|uniref:acetate--CoA ligase family protein n=1 Tax=Roseibium sp. RKSG952 TaxID=2529384 RepID=UPI0012BC9362|nr:acetate--CoA ligase family protein [Roseibium sp. RKSG952]MTH97448.1 CoA-binding protein [Roseibium sp. RKSG952]
MRPLDRLLRPRSIAVIGGGTWCENVIRECRKAGFSGDLFAVHPTKNLLTECPAYPTLDDLPAVPDAAFVGVNRHLTIEMVRKLAELGAGGAVCFASGFSEAVAELDDAGSLQDGLVAAAGEMPILGPNCYGYLNALDGAALWPDQHGLTPVSNGVAIISQSSNIALNLTMQARGLPIAYIITAGNQAQTGLADIGMALLQDDRVTAIGLYIEGIGGLKAFEAFARQAAAAGKPVVVLKVGKSEQARTATISHTASLAGSSAGADALFTRLGIAQVASLPVLLETLKLFHVTGSLPSARLASMSCSGGEASLIADIAAERRVSFPPLTQVQKTRLRDALGAKVALANPLDYHTYIWGDVDAMCRTFEAMASGPVDLCMVILDLPRSDRCRAEAWFKVIDAIELAMTASGKPFAVLSSLPESLPETVAVDLISRGIVPLCGMEEAMDAIEAAARSGLQTKKPDLHRPSDIDTPTTLPEDEAKALLAQFGLRIPKSTSASGADDAACAAERIGYPVVLKGSGIAHKTEAGAVALDLSCARDVLEAAHKMPVQSYLVEEMVTGILAELLVGIVHDPAHGLVLTLAAGGIMTELLADSVSLIVPAERTDIEEALQGLKIAQVLTGYRGRPASDINAILDAVMALQDFAIAVPVKEVEINPLLCGKDFAIAADALVKRGETHDG